MLTFAPVRHKSHSYEVFRYFLSPIINVLSLSLRVVLSFASLWHKVLPFLPNQAVIISLELIFGGQAVGCLLSLRGGRSYRAGKEGETPGGGGRGVCHTERTEERPSESYRQPVHPLALPSSPTEPPSLPWICAHLWAGSAPACTRPQTRVFPSLLAARLHRAPRPPPPPPVSWTAESYAETNPAPVQGELIQP